MLDKWQCRVRFEIFSTQINQPEVRETVVEKESITITFPNSIDFIRRNYDEFWNSIDYSCANANIISFNTIFHLDLLPSVIHENKKKTNNNKYLKQFDAVLFFLNSKQLNVFNGTFVCIETETKLRLVSARFSLTVTAQKGRFVWRVRKINKHSDMLLSNLTHVYWVERKTNSLQSSVPFTWRMHT